METITAAAVTKAEADWSCRGCGLAITADHEYSVLYRNYRQGAVIRTVPLRFHFSCLEGK